MKVVKVVKKGAFVGLFATTLLSARPVSAAPLSFSCMSGNSAATCGMLESQLTVPGLQNFVNAPIENAGAPSISGLYTAGGSTPALFGAPSDLMSALDTGAFLIGMKVSGFATSGPEAVISGGTPVPEPASLLLLGTGMFLLARQVRKRTRRRSPRSA